MAHFFSCWKWSPRTKWGGEQREERKREESGGGGKNKEIRGRCAEIVVVWPEASWAEQRWSLSLTAWIQHTLHHTNSTKAARAPRGTRTHNAWETYKARSASSGKHKASLLARPQTDRHGFHSVLIIFAFCALRIRLAPGGKTTYTQTPFLSLQPFPFRRIILRMVCAETSYIRNSCRTTVIYYNKATSLSQKCPSKQFNSQWHSSATHYDFYWAENDSYCVLPRSPPTAISA